MRILFSTLLSWLITTAIYSATFHWDGIPFSLSDIANIFPLFLITGLVSGLYFLILGGVALLILKYFNLEKQPHFIMAALLYSSPMLLATFASGEIEWFIATVLATITTCLIIRFSVLKNN